MKQKTMDPERSVPDPVLTWRLTAGRLLRLMYASAAIDGLRASLLRSVAEQVNKEADLTIRKIVATNTLKASRRRLGSAQESVMVIKKYPGLSIRALTYATNYFPVPWVGAEWPLTLRTNPAAST
jgi:hypothetical protein